MFSDITYQDYLAAPDPSACLLDAIARYKFSPFFQQALTADAYFHGQNTAISRKTILQACKMEGRDEHGRKRVRAVLQDVVGNRIGSSFLSRFIIQQNQFLLGNGCTLADASLKARLGKDFDHQLAQLGEHALLHGVSYAYWNTNHLELLSAASSPLSGFFPLLDETTGEIRLGVHFWQLSSKRPLYIRLFQEDGITLFTRVEGHLQEVQPKRPYVLLHRSDAFGESETPLPVQPHLPIFPLYANSSHKSEFTPAIKAKIDAYDNILSDFADNLDRANDVYWVLNNFGGTTDDIAELLEEIHRIKAVANISDGTGNHSTAEPHTIEVPYEARQTALRLLEKALYDDYMALDLSALTGGSLTNVAIRAACANLNLKADRYEWEVFHFVRSLLLFLGINTEEIRFTRQDIANAHETIADIAAMRPDIDRRTALKLNPYLQPEEVESLLSKEDTPSAIR